MRVRLVASRDLPHERASPTPRTRSPSAPTRTPSRTRTGPAGEPGRPRPRRTTSSSAGRSGGGGGASEVRRPGQGPIDPTTATSSAAQVTGEVRPVRRPQRPDDPYAAPRPGGRPEGRRGDARLVRHDAGGPAPRGHGRLRRAEHDGEQPGRDSQDTPGNPPVGSRVVATWSVLPGESELVICGVPVAEVVSVLQAAAGTRAKTTYGRAVLRVAREHVGKGTVEDDRTLFVLDDSLARPEGDRSVSTTLRHRRLEFTA